MNLKSISEIWLDSLDGTKLNLLEKYSNEPLLLLFYNNRCLGCTGRAIPLAYQYMNEFSGLRVIGVHSNFNNEEVNKEDILNIFTTKELPFPIYIDRKHEVYDQFECEGTPQWILINRKAEIIKSIFGSQEAAQNRLPYAITELID